MKKWLITQAAALLTISGCSQHPASRSTEEPPVSPPAVLASISNDKPDPCAMVLVPHRGETKLDRQIIRCQKKIQSGQNGFESLDLLGWLYVAKARESFDPGYYKLAEQCSDCLDSRQPHCAEALLLRGHAFQNLHKFKEAEPLARELVAKRGRSFDYGLLGDVLMEQGKLEEAAAAYQSMVDIKPDLEAYARIAHFRWLKGDLAAAAELMQVAAGAASPNAPESAAWVNTRLAFFQFQRGDIKAAGQGCEVALDYQTNYAPALLLRGRLLLAGGHNDEAVDALTLAERINPLPDYQWTLCEALHAAGRDDQATLVEQRLNQHGAGTDPRTYAVYLSTKGGASQSALKLARKEIITRGDVFTHDALAWALLADGQKDAAYQEIQRAVAEGTREARLFFHATIIAAQSGHSGEAKRWFGKTAAMLPQLLPSEQKLFQQIAIGIAQADHLGAAAKTGVTAKSKGN